MLVLAAVVGLIGISLDSSNGAAADRNAATAPSNPSTVPTSTASSGARPTKTHEVRALDKRGDTTGPDLLKVSAGADGAMLWIRTTLAGPITDDDVIRVFVDGDSDRTTGSLAFPCAAATLGADYEIATRGDHIEHFMASKANGCAAPFEATKSAGLTIHATGDRLSLGIPLSAVRRPGKHVIGLYAQALRSTGGQIDSCPGQHDRPVSVHY